MEIFKEIEGYENYQISNLGNVKSLNYKRTGKDKILKPIKDKKGYLMVNLCKQAKSKTYKIHRLVAQAFLPNQNNLPQVNHKDEDKQNNAASNLEWCTNKYNSNYGTRNQRVGKSNINHTKRSKQVLCVENGVIYPSTMELQRQLGLPQQNISHCCNGKRKTCGGFHWCYV